MLEWELSEIKNYEEICYEPLAPLAGASPNEPTRYQLAAITESLIHACQIVGVPRISESTATTVFVRIARWEAERGPIMKKRRWENPLEWEPRPVTFGDVVEHIGLFTSASRQSRTDYVRMLCNLTGKHPREFADVV